MEGKKRIDKDECKRDRYYVIGPDRILLAFGYGKRPISEEVFRAAREINRELQKCLDS